MTKGDGEIRAVVLDVLRDYCETRDIEAEIDEDSRLLGDDSVLSSVGLVTVILDVEARFKEEGFDVSLTSEQALSQNNSPFASVKTLAEYIQEQLRSPK